MAARRACERERTDSPQPRPSDDDEDADDDNVLLRLENCTERGCRAAFTAYDPFAPDPDALDASDMHHKFLNRADFALLLEAINYELEHHRRLQKISSFGMVFGSIAAIVLAIFVVPAGVSLQFAILLTHVVATRQLRTRCGKRLDELLDTEVNPALEARGIAIRVRSRGDSCSSYWYVCDVCRLPTYTDLATAAPPAAVVPGPAVVHFDDDFDAADAVVASPTTQGSPALPGAAEVDDGTVVVGMPVGDDDGSRRAASMSASMSRSSGAAGGAGRRSRGTGAASRALGLKR